MRGEGAAYRRFAELIPGWGLGFASALAKEPLDGTSRSKVQVDLVPPGPELVHREQYFYLKDSQAAIARSSVSMASVRALSLDRSLHRGEWRPRLLAPKLKPHAPWRVALPVRFQEDSPKDSKRIFGS